MSRRIRSLVGFVVAGVLLGLAPWAQTTFDLPRFYLIFLFTIFFWTTQASSWNILTGYSGYFSFGQGAFYGIGVYTTSILVAKHGWSFLAALPLAGVAAAVFAFLLGLVVFRVRRLTGEIFALTTLAVAFVLASTARLLPAIDGGVGIFMTGTPLPELLGDFTSAMYWMTLLITLVTVGTAYGILQTRLGWGLAALRDDEQVASGVGVPTFRYKMLALVVSSGLAGLMGGVWALQLGFVTVADVFSIRVPLFVILMSVLGGTRHWMGPVVGAVVITTLTDRLNSAGLEDVNQLIIGGLLVVLVLAVPEGIYLRLRERSIPSAVVFVVAAIASVVLLSETSFITVFSYGLLAVVPVALVPRRMWRRWSSPAGEPTPPVEEHDQQEVDVR